MKTAQELAKELSVTVQTIRNESQRQKTKLVPKSEGRGYCFSDEDAEKIRQAIRKRKVDSERARLNNISAREVESLRKKVQTVDEEIEKRETRIKELEQTMDARIKELEQLIAVRDETIKNCQEQILQLTQSLANVTESLKASQVLHMGTMKQIEKHGRKWWQFWKARTDETTEEQN